MQAANRVVLNTGFLYGRMLITMLISLYSTRLILSALGVDDYGVFNLIGGVIGMLSFLNGAMAVSTQRYLSYYLGSGDSAKLNAVFRSSVLLHLIIGVLVIIVFEVIGFFIFNGFLNIPEHRVFSAKMVYQFMIISTFFTINAVPYDASINAHEKMLFDAIVGVVEAVFKLGIAIYLLVYQHDKLIMYGILIAALTILVRIIKSIYCYRNFDECTLDRSKKVDFSLLKEMFSFAGWNLFGTFCHVARNQGLAIVLNLFFGVVVNAAYGIANQVNAQISAFSTNLMKAVNPQIIKSEGGNDRKRMLRIAMTASKMSFFLLSLFVIPLILEMEYILDIWLKDVPEYTVVFCQLILLLSVVTQLTVGLRPAIQSVGKIRAYQITVGSLLLLNLPVSYLLVKNGIPAYSVLLVSIALELVAGSLRIYFANKVAQMPVKEYIIRIVLISSLLFVLIYGISYFVRSYFDQGFLRLIITTLTSSISLVILVRTIALTKEEAKKINEVISIFVQKIKKRTA